MSGVYIANSHPRQGEKKLGEKPLIHPSCIVRDSTLGAWTEIYANCELQETIFGDYSYAAGDVTIIYAEIGKFCSIASHVRINPGNHPMQRVTQHHCTYRRRQFGFANTDDDEFFDWRRSHKCMIGHDVWIGHGAVIMSGVSVGTGAVIGAGAVVTKDVAPYDIVAGVPARRIKKRFPDDMVEKLLAIAWWEWDRPTLEQRFSDLSDVHRFIEKYIGLL
ncbi:phosphonate metabolism protein (transferase hexapeptide repeat family) [Sporomusaceae bacterium BoRhaA]|uniref:DapH/DapD/GlmU-related protein n=1 Tax=Pelorhabdus rhamnosifermentans TaxID=2772457 RepID=UPI001C062338|nr:DapH/DapD/GlmU-related protein [Pelorhabdus rhamnosifermentans]MBU2699502.1 phosphonate metabolism protein (transferase hexapeptide repeat family) [Pelorhabdus rhamnosifermentans]